MNASSLVYEIDPWHSYSWRRFLAEETEAVPSILNDAEVRESSAWGLLGREVFSRLLSGDEIDEVEEPADWAKRCHEEAASLPEWHQLVEICKLDRLGAGAAALAITRSLHEIHEKLGIDPDAPGESGEGESGDQPGAAAPGAGDAQQPGQQGSSPAPGQQPGKPGPKNGKGSVSREDLVRSAIRSSVKRTASKAAEEVKALQETIETFGRAAGIAEDRLAANIDPETSRSLSAVLGRNPAIRRIAALAGRFRATMKKKRASMAEGAPAELSDITLGGDLSRTVPVELARPRRRATRLDVLSRLMNRAALVYEVSGKEPQERGPIVICFDQSGSMSEAGRFEWAKAITLAIASVAAESGREVRAIGFNGGVQWKGAFPSDLGTVSSLLSLGPSGGTSWTAPLREAREIIESDPKMAKADVIFITDGEASMPEDFAAEFKAWRRERGVSAFSVLLAPFPHETVLSELRKFSDQAWTVNSAATGPDAGTENLVHAVAEVL